jgi:predicted dehydrogenase
MAVAIGLVGAGRRATEVHAPSLAACPDVAFAGVWARSSEGASDLAGRYGVTVFHRYEELLDHCDAVAFAVPPAVQPDLATAAVHRAKAVLLENPIAGDLAGAEQLAAAVSLSGVVSQLALTWRYAPAVRQFLTTAVPRTRAMGGSGRVVSGAASGGSSVSAWRRERGVLLDQGPNLVDLLDAALGRVVGVRAHGDPLGWIGLLLEHEGGRFSEASLSAAVPVEPERAEVEIFGSGGAAEIDCAAVVGPDTFETMFREFADAVAHGMPHKLDVHRGLRLQQVIDAAETDLIRSV